MLSTQLVTHCMSSWRIMFVSVSCQSRPVPQFPASHAVAGESRDVWCDLCLHDCLLSFLLFSSLCLLFLSLYHHLTSFSVLSIISAQSVPLPSGGNLFPFTVPPLEELHLFHLHSALNALLFGCFCLLIISSHAVPSL